MGRCVIVIGQHRGGTSATAGVLYRLGVDMNPTTGDGVGDDHEDRQLYELNDRAIGHWFRPSNNFSEFKGEYARVLSERDKKGLWGFKDPRVVFFWDDITSLIRSELYLVRVQRPLEASARSLVARDGARLEHLTYHEAFLLTCRYEWRATQIYRFCDEKRRLWVEYDDLIDHTHREVERMANFLGLPVSREAIDFIHKDMRHYD